MLAGVETPAALSAQREDLATGILQLGGHGLVASEEEDLALTCDLLDEVECSV